LQIDAIVISGKGSNFSVGADITEFGGSGIGNFPNLLDVSFCNKLLFKHFTFKKMQYLPKQKM